MKNEQPQSPLPFYVALLLYEASSDSLDYKPLYQESIMLITAISEEAARQKVLNIAQTHSYDNEQGETITWTLKHLVDVQRALSDDFLDGTELYARHFRNYEAYRSFEPLLSHEEL